MKPDFRPKKSVFLKTRKYLANHTRVLSDLKITKLGKKARNHPLFCVHEHCDYWRRRSTLNRDVANNKIRKSLGLRIEGEEEED